MVFAPRSSIGELWHKIS